MWHIPASKHVLIGFWVCLFVFFVVAVAVSVSGSVAATAALSAERLVLFCQFTTFIEQGPRTFSQSLSLSFSVSLTTHLSLSLCLCLVSYLSLSLSVCVRVCFRFAVIVLTVVFVCWYVCLNLHVRLFSGLWAIWAYEQTI